MYWPAVFEVKFYISDTNKVISFIFSADLERLLLPLFSGEVVPRYHIKLQSCVSDSQKEFEVTFVSLV